jgi:hypothetical protein
MRGGTSVRAGAWVSSVWLFSPAARADVVQAGPGGFAVHHRVMVALEPDVPSR